MVLAPKIPRAPTTWVPGGSNQLLRVWARSPNGNNRLSHMITISWAKFLAPVSLRIQLFIRKKSHLKYFHCDAKSDAKAGD